MDVPPRLWDVKNSRASGKSVEAQRINLAIDKIRVEVNHRHQELIQAEFYGKGHNSTGQAEADIETTCVTHWRNTYRGVV